MLILCHSLREPKSNFLLRRFYSIGSMDDIAANVNAKVPTYGARCRCKRVGSTDDQSSSFDHLFSFPHHAHHRSRADVIHQSREERFGGEICIVFFCQGLFDHFQLQRFEEVPFFFEPLDDLPHQSALHAVWLDHDVGSFHGVCFFRRLCLFAMVRSPHSSLPAFDSHEMVTLVSFSLNHHSNPEAGNGGGPTHPLPSPPTEKKLPNGGRPKGWLTVFKPERSHTTSWVVGRRERIRTTSATRNDACMRHLGTDRTVTWSKEPHVRVRGNCPVEKGIQARVRRFGQETECYTCERRIA